MRIQSYALFAILFVATIVALGAAQAHSSGEVAKQLVVASDLDNPPFSFVNESGDPAGRDVWMMELLAQEIGRELKSRKMPFEQLLH